MTSAAMRVSSSPRAAQAPARQDWDRVRARLWAVSFSAMMALHVAALAFAVWWHPQAEPVSPPPPAAVMIELAPMTPSPAPPSEAPPGIERQAARPVETAVEEPPKPEPVKKAEVRLPKPKPKPVVKPAAEAPPAEQVVERTTAPIAAPIAALPGPAAPKMTAPAPGAPSPPSTAAPTWQGALRAHLERYKRYPSAARLRRQEGVSYVRFSINRDGTVRWARLERASGFSRLDDESLALMERAQPVPPPPPEVPGNAIEIVVPIEFFLK